jgi:hypothetical protein
MPTDDEAKNRIRMVEENQRRLRRDTTSPMLVAWSDYQLTANFLESKQWGQTIQIQVIDAPHMDGALWASFEAGWNACLKSMSQQRSVNDE